MNCKQEGCERKVQAKGLCWGHYQRLRAGSPLDGPIRRMRTPRRNAEACRHVPCGRPAAKQGLCQTHYLRDLFAPERMSEPIEERRGWTHNINIPRDVVEGARAEQGRRGIGTMAPILREWMRAGFEAWLEERRQEALQRHDFGRQRNSGPRRYA